MRIMTFNLRFENERDGENAWAYRREMVVEVIRRYAPSILGTQEGLRPQLDYLSASLPEYRIHLPPERVLDARSQCPTLFYRPEALGLEEGGEFWLSKTPQKHLSKDWDSAFPRMISYGLFRDKEAGDRFWAAVTHLDHIGVEARSRQADLIRRWVARRTEPVVLMGDFNEAPGADVHRTLLSKATGLEDTWQLAGRFEGSESMTSHDFSGTPQKSRLDWILVSSRFRVKTVSIVRDHRDHRYPSDHFPYFADIDWT